MSIPIDKLYHYIENIAQDIRGDAVVIYRFYPHGSKKIEDLLPLQNYSGITRATSPQIYCYDQEPLDYDRYANRAHHSVRTRELLEKYGVAHKDYNLCIDRFHIYDQHLLIHSEQRSINLDKYVQDKYFITVYYWSHAIIARDWFRYAAYDSFDKDIKKTFLIYNRAWSGTREYRLKFVDLLIELELIDVCQVTINPTEPELGIHYSNYNFINNTWAPTHRLENYVPNTTTAPSSSSADYCREDYNSTEFEVVLETLFDDDRLQLTEKILRPIACNQPFLLLATCNSLKYLHSYGFRTFASVIDESYDDIEDPELRLKAVVNTMKTITHWSDEERSNKLKLINQITAYNRKHFFSDKFINQVVDELRTNLAIGLDTVEATNTSARLIDRRKELAQYDEFKANIVIGDRPTLVKTLLKAREYYNRR